jgi:hypothetical protein
LLQIASVTGLSGIVFTMTLPASAIALAWYRVAMIASDRESAYSRTTDQGHAADLLGFYASQVQKAVAKAAQVVVLPEKIVGVTTKIAPRW